MCVPLVFLWYLWLHLRLVFISLQEYDAVGTMCQGEGIMSGYVLCDVIQHASNAVEPKFFLSLSFLPFPFPLNLALLLQFPVFCIS